MKLGFVSAILPDLELEQVLATAAELGYDCVEVCCWPKGKAERRYAGVTHIEVDDFNETKNRLEGYPIEMPERVTFYGMREVGVFEPGGHTVVFAARTAEAATS